MTALQPTLPPRAPRGEVSAQRTEGSWSFALEAEDAEPARSQERIPSQVIVELLGVLASVQLNNDEDLQTDEVADVGSDRMLPAELKVGQLPSAQMLPKETFSIGWRFAEFSGVSEHAALLHEMPA